MEVDPDSEYESNDADAHANASAPNAAAAVMPKSLKRKSPDQPADDADESTNPGPNASPARWIQAGGTLNAKRMRVAAMAEAYNERFKSAVVLPSTTRTIDLDIDWLGTEQQHNSQQQKKQQQKQAAANLDSFVLVSKAAIPSQRGQDANPDPIHIAKNANKKQKKAKKGNREKSNVDTESHGHRGNTLNHENSNGHGNGHNRPVPSVHGSGLVVRPSLYYGQRPLVPNFDANFVYKGQLLKSAHLRVLNHIVDWINFRLIQKNWNKQGAGLYIWSYNFSVGKTHLCNVLEKIFKLYWWVFQDSKWQMNWVDSESYDCIVYNAISNSEVLEFRQIELHGDSKEIPIPKRNQKRCDHIKANTPFIITSNRPVEKLGYSEEYHSIGAWKERIIIVNATGYPLFPLTDRLIEMFNIRFPVETPLPESLRAFPEI